MRTIFIFSILLSSYLSIQLSSSAGVFPNMCNGGNHDELFFPLNISFNSFLNDQRSFNINATTLIPCSDSSTFKLKIKFKYIDYKIIFNGQNKLLSGEFEDTKEMTYTEFYKWYQQSKNEFSFVVVQGSIKTDYDSSEITFRVINTDLFGYLDNFNIPFVLEETTYNIDEILKSREPPAKKIVETKEISPELMELFKNQLTNNSQYSDILNQLKNGNAQSTIVSKDDKKITTVIQTFVVQKSKDNSKNFLV